MLQAPGERAGALDGHRLTELVLTAADGEVGPSYGKVATGQGQTSFTLTDLDTIFGAYHRRASRVRGRRPPQWRSSSALHQAAEQAAAQAVSRPSQPENQVHPLRLLITFALVRDCCTDR